MVSGNDDGIAHTFKLTEDAFATADKGLVNHKKYYYIAIAYAYNQYKLYDPEDGTSLDGQKLPYLRGRKSASGSIKTFEAIPHKNSIQNGGTVINSTYGEGIPVTQMEGMGNGNNTLNLKQSTLDKIMEGYPWRADNIEYKAGEGPINVKIVDPLNVKNDTYILRFDSVKYSSTANLEESGVIENASWYMYSEEYDSTLLDTTIMVMINDSVAVESDVKTININPAVAFKLTNEKYKLGQVINTQFREAQFNLIKTKNNYNNSEFNARLAELEIIKLSGILLTQTN
jgi:hypothetical protein